jgi:hypothetical protein
MSYMQHDPRAPETPKPVSSSFYAEVLQETIAADLTKHSVAH